MDSAASTRKSLEERRDALIELSRERDDEIEEVKAQGRVQMETLRYLGLLKEGDEDKQTLGSIQDEILKAIEPFRKSNRVLEISAAELTVMAVLCCHDDCPTDRQVSDWIVRTFPYYTRLARDLLYQFSHLSSGNRSRDLYSDNKQPHNLNRAGLGDLYDVPLVERVSGGPLYRPLPVKYYVDPDQGRIFLRKWLEPGREGTFRFLDLPAEIRVTIYEYVFTFPPSGLGFFGLDKRYKSYSNNRLLIPRGADGDGASIKNWRRAIRNHEINQPYSVQSAYLRPKPMNEILALLNVNKQIYEEAMPYFYRCNHFHVDDLYQLSHLLGGCGAKRRQHFGSISFWYGPTKGRVVATKCFRFLAEAKNLRFLQLEAGDEEYTPPAMDTLKKVRAQKVEFLGECAEIKEYLKETTETPKVEEEATPKKRKRASKNDAPESEQLVAEAGDETVKPKRKARKVAITDTTLGHWVRSGEAKKKRRSRQTKVATAA